MSNRGREEGVEEMATRMSAETADDLIGALVDDLSPVRRSPRLRVALSWLGGAWLTVMTLSVLFAPDRVRAARIAIAADPVATIAVIALAIAGGAACLAALAGRQGINETINIGSDENFTVLELAKIIIEITNSKSQIVHLPPLEDGDMTRRLPDISKMRALLGRDLVPVREGLGRLVDYYTSQGSF